MDKQYRNSVLLGHALGFCGFLVPLGHILAPLIWWAMKRDESEWVDYAGKNIINFQLTFTLYYTISVLLFVMIIGVFTFIVTLITHNILMLIALIRTANEQLYKYPLTIPFLR